MSQVTIKRLSPAMQRQISNLIEQEIRRQAMLYGYSEQNVLAAIRQADIVVKQTICNDMDPVFIDDLNTPDSINRIMINPDTNEPFGAVLAHEYARFLMRYWLPQAAFGADTVICHEGDNAQVRFNLAVDVHKKFVFSKQKR